MKIVSCSYNVTRPRDGKTMCAGILQSDRHRIGVAIKKQRSHGVNRTQSHASGSSGSENAVGQLFPKACVRSFTPNFFKLTEPLPNFFTSCSVSGHHSFNCDGFLITLHCSLSIARFYERAGNIVNDLGHSPHPCSSVAKNNLHTHVELSYDGCGILVWPLSIIDALPPVSQL